ncbi:hypothetical protein ACFYOT_15925 [Saccharothrix saharensis]|uniref:hypothetical protein n=1 Tax=Saccharothrix saharensis TaxID=571190 RepID=UPI0036819F6B
MPDEYTPQEKAALMVLMLEGKEVLNRDLVNLHKIRLGQPGRDKLNEAGLLETWSEKRRFVHRITDEGITWCLKDLSEGEPPSRSGPWARAQSEVLKRCIRYLVEQGVSLAEVVRSGGDLESVIRAAYLELSVKPQDWVRLAKLRPKLNGADKEEVDAVLLEMVKTGTVHLAPDSNRKVLTDADHAAAVRVAGEDNHLVAIEES